MDRLHTFNRDITYEYAGVPDARQGREGRLSVILYLSEMYQIHVLSEMNNT